MTEKLEPLKIGDNREININNRNLVSVEPILDSIKTFHERLADCENKTINTSPNCVADTIAAVEARLQLIIGGNKKITDEQREILIFHQETMLDFNVERKKIKNKHDPSYPSFLKRFEKELAALSDDILEIKKSENYNNEN